MKLNCLIRLSFPIFFLLSSFALNAQEVVRIPVNELVPASHKLLEEPYEKVVEKSCGFELQSLSEEHEPGGLVYSDIHPFIGALHFAFADHRPVSISPDMIWLLINQSFAIHIHENSEEYEDLLVPFEGKYDLRLEKNVLEIDWAKTVQEFADSTVNVINESVSENILHEFSTTTINERIALEVSLMSTVDPFVMCSLHTYCGIPYINIEGTPEDWLWIYNQLEYFDPFGLERWTENLRLILMEFYESSKGNADLDFWRSFYKWEEESGGSQVTGRVVQFFLYKVGEQGEYKINSLAMKAYVGKLPEGNEKANFWGLEGLRATELSSGISQCDFTWYDCRSIPCDTLNMAMMSGFVGIRQDQKTLCLRPEISWAVVNKERSIRVHMDEFLLDTYHTSCSGIDITEGINQLPIFNPEVFGSDYRKSHEAFGEYIEEEMKMEISYYDISEIKKLRLEITKKGKVKFISVEGVTGLELTILSRIVKSSGVWEPAVIDGEKRYYIISFFD